MTSTLPIAFKEWAVICKALAAGRQALILRKGGIAEDGGTFRPEHSRFWLQPTYFHEHRDGILPEFVPFLDAAEADRPPAGTLRLTHFAEVHAVHRVDDLNRALALAPFHGWTDAIVKQRFHYRTPGLFVLVVRIHAASAIEVLDRPEYAGCKTWVTLDPPPVVHNTCPVLDGAAFQAVVSGIEAALAPR